VHVIHTLHVVLAHRPQQPLGRLYVLVKYANAQLVGHGTGLGQPLVCPDVQIERKGPLLQCG
jgi:hypothetical protein